jgi:hypothetical protein
MQRRTRATETISVDAGSLVGSKLEVGTVYHKGEAAKYLGRRQGGQLIGMEVARTGSKFVNFFFHFVSPLFK